ncbi:MAG: M28 family peptidase [Parabacteroides sp.]|nr:M28 family peptidase [Parabacteroides sp.]
MNKGNLFIFIIILILSALIAYGWQSLPTPKGKDYKGFSSGRVVEDLKIIAKEPHSVAHPEARTAVRDYLKEKLKTLGGEVRVYHYPSQKAKGYIFHADNLLAEFPPMKPLKDTTYLMLIAHYDSKYPMKRNQEIVSSFGAGDDGYGIGVILESLNQVLKFREVWNQGIKVLFTDAEEVGMVGMKLAYQSNKEIFEHVGLVINIEARGTYGPVLLFETSPGNEKLMELYGNHAQYPYTYSLTSVVYKFMPNDTDFSIVKDTIPGFNFSVIADVNHYHTELDHLDNISEISLQHYGEQIVPIIKHYLTNSKYNNKNYFHSDKDSINFTIPLLGFFHFPQTGYWALNICITVLFLFILFQNKKRRNFNMIELIKQSGKLFLISLGILVIGELIAWICARMAGVRFTLFGTVSGISYDNTAMIVAMAVMSIAVVCYYIKQRLYDSILTLYSTLSILCLLSWLLLFSFGENMMFFIPLACATLALFFWQISSLRIFLWIAVLVISLHAFSFTYILAMALTIGTLGVVMLLAFYYIMVLIALPLWNNKTTYIKTNNKWKNY